jgi:putative radical SAM enzyme (TIGR03279 family)
MDKPTRAQVEGRPTTRELEVGLRIETILPEGIGEAIGLMPNDVLECINDEPIRDAIDYRFHLGNEDIEVQIRRGADVFIFEIEKDLEDDLGLEFEEMPILKCDNKCVFCFLHQMPKGMRKTLYYQDDDYRLSFLHGAYVTLTNLSDEEFERIIDQRLNPMYISVHATDPTLRAELLGRKDPTPVLNRIDVLAQEGIRMHTQVVLCPGVNDGQALKQTIFDLADRHPHIESVGVVPLGLTKYRKNLPELTPVSVSDAQAAIAQITQWQALFQKQFGARFVYLGDEFYLKAGINIPAPGAYDGFPLVENGIGMVRRFIDAFDDQVEVLEQMDVPPQQFVLVTGVLGQQFLAPMVDRLNQIPWISARLVPVVNTFLGEGITVSGLLTGADIQNAVQEVGVDKNEFVLLPPNCVNHNGLFLDDLTPTNLTDHLKCSVVVGTYDLVETLQNALDGISMCPIMGSQEVAHPYISSHQVDV